MSTVDLPVTVRPPGSFDVEAIFPKVDLVETDGQNMDSEWQRLNIELLIAAIRFQFRNRDDYYAGGNSFIYYSKKQFRNTDFKGPDFFVVRGAAREPIRPYWAVWEEDGLYPNVIVELLSPTTANEDLTNKKRVYEQTFRTPNYFCFDPATRELFGWNLQHEGANQVAYQRLPLNEHGRLWCDELQLWIGPWQGRFAGYDDVWLRFFDTDGQLVPTPEEYERDQAEKQRVRAETERQRAEVEQHRAEAAEAELARLKALLAEKGITP